MLAYSKLHHIAYDHNAISSKPKEMITLGIALTEKCEGCLMSQTVRLIELGATREEIADVIGVAIAMSEGPATAYGVKVLTMYDAFTQE